MSIEYNKNYGTWLIIYALISEKKTVNKGGETWGCYNSETLSETHHKSLYFKTWSAIIFRMTAFITQSPSEISQQIDSGENTGLKTLSSSYI